MSASTEPADLADNYLTHTRGFKSWLFTLDHKRIGVMFLACVWAAMVVWAKVRGVCDAARGVREGISGFGILAFGRGVLVRGAGDAACGANDAMCSAAGTAFGVGAADSESDTSILEAGDAGC